jgi:serine/threonine protein kinase
MTTVHGLTHRHPAVRLSSVYCQPDNPFPAVTHVAVDGHFHSYADNVVDMWSVGCILAELLGGKPIFKGEDYVDQLNKILNFLGTPTEDTLRRVGSPRAQE